MAEPKEATFWESVIEILRDWLSLWQAKNTSTQRKQVLRISVHTCVATGGGLFESTDFLPTAAGC